MKEEVSEILKSVRVESSVIFPSYNISNTATTISGSLKDSKKKVYNDDIDSINSCGDSDDASIEMGLLPSDTKSSSFISVKDHTGDQEDPSSNKCVTEKNSELSGTMETGVSRRHSVSQ